MIVTPISSPHKGITRSAVALYSPILSERNLSCPPCLSLMRSTQFGFHCEECGTSMQYYDYCNSCRNYSPDILVKDSDNTKTVDYYSKMMNLRKKNPMYSHAITNYGNFHAFELDDSFEDYEIPKELFDKAVYSEDFCPATPPISCGPKKAPDAPKKHRERQLY